jgi:peptide/nickel transport system permease protein
MIKFTIRRLLQGIPTIIGITILSFAIMAAAPGGPTAALNFSPSSTPQQREEMRARLGIDDPLPQQYFRWLVGDLASGNEAHGDGILRGDFGESFTSRKPVTDIIIQQMPATVELTGLSLLIGLLIGIPIGTLAAVWQGGLFDQLSRVLAVIAQAVPGFWLGLMLILFWGGNAPEWKPEFLPTLPMGNRCDTGNLAAQAFANPNATPSCPPLLERLDYIMLPVFVLATGWVAVFSRFMRASVLDVLNQDYVRTAKAKGLADGTVWFGHAARNALIPIATFLGPAIPGLLAGAVITETVFSWPGLGKVFVDAVRQQDYPMVMAGTLIGGIGTIVGYVLSDILYALIDPRIRLS